MKYGYARVSTEDQNPALQLAALKKAGCQTVFKDEGLSGATTSALPSPLPEEAGTRRHADCVEARPAGPQPARPDHDAGRPPRRGVKFHSLTEAIDTETPTGRAMWQMIGVLAELERSLDLRAHPRRSEGRAAARREVWAEGETDARADRPCAEADRSRHHGDRRRKDDRHRPHDPLPRLAAGSGVRTCCDFDTNSRPSEN